MCWPKNEYFVILHCVILALVWNTNSDLRQNIQASWKCSIQQIWIEFFFTAKLQKIEKNINTACKHLKSSHIYIYTHYTCNWWLATPVINYTCLRCIKTLDHRRRFHWVYSLLSALTMLKSNIKLGKHTWYTKHIQSWVRRSYITIKQMWRTFSHHVLSSPRIWIKVKNITQSGQNHWNNHTGM